MSCYIHEWSILGQNSIVWAGDLERYSQKEKTGPTVLLNSGLHADRTTDKHPPF
jgi:hypothetical protein